MRYNHIAPTGTFISDYMAHMSEVETATSYDFWCALWLMSVAVGRNVIVDRPNAPVYMNLYTILVAASGVTRKSTAVNSAKEIAHALLEDDLLMGMIGGKIVPEKLDLLLHDRTVALDTAQVAIAISELAIFLGNERYTSTMPTLLTDLYDCPAVRDGGGTISRGACNQHNVFVNLLAASTPEWLFDVVNPSVIAGGFTSRCLFIVSEEAKRSIPWPNAKSRSNASLVDTLRVLRSKAREYATITLNDGAIKEFSKWYGKRSHNIDKFRASFESREDAHVLRIAAFLCINDGSWVIQVNHIKTAINIIASVKEDAYCLFDDNRQQGKWVLALAKLTKELMKAGSIPIQRSKLFLSMRRHLDNAEFSAMLDVLIETQGIMMLKVGKQEGIPGRPAELYVGTSMLTSKGYVNRVLERLM